jgi:multiple sugar transport system substrate-binding protein
VNLGSAKAAFFRFAAGTLLAGIAGCASRGSGPVEIVYWTGWSSHEFEVQQGLVDEFNRTHPWIHVRLASQFGNSGYQKVRIAFAGAATPDLMSTVWADELASYAQRDVLTPLDGYLKASGRDFDREFVPSLRNCLRVDGKVYAMAVTTNSQFIVYNKDLFRQAGLKAVPADADELMAASRACTVSLPDGRFERYGFRPTELRSWAYTFGGKWFDPVTKRITANDPRNVAALRWMASFNKFIDPREAAAFQATFGSDYTPSGPFFVGKIAMWQTGEWAGEFLRRYAPGVHYGFFALPPPPGGRRDAGGVNGSVFVIPKACRHKHEAWEFLNWLTSPGPVEKFCSAIGNVPPLVSVGNAPEFQKDPLFRFAVRLSRDENAIGPPGIAMWPTYTREISRAEDAVMLGGQDPKQVLDDLQIRMDREYRETEEELRR